MALRMNISAPIRSSNSATLSRHAASLVDCTRKKFFSWGVRVGCDVISGGLLGHLGPLCLALGVNHEVVVFR